MGSLTAGKTLLLKAVGKARTVQATAWNRGARCSLTVSKWVVTGDVASEMGVALTWKAMPGMERVLTLVQKTAVQSGPTLALDRVNGSPMVTILEEDQWHWNFLKGVFVKCPLLAS